MRMYGISLEDQFHIMRKLHGDLEGLLRKADATPTADILMEAELAAACAHDHLRDMAIWLRGTRQELDRVANQTSSDGAQRTNVT